MILKANLIIVAIDDLLNQMLNAILHHPQFQALESRWKSIFILLNKLPKTDKTRLRLLDINWRELSRDLLTAIDFDQSQLFKKVYTEEFDQPGGTPYSLLLADYLIDPRSLQGKKDVQVLSTLAGVAAAAFTPCIINISHEFLGVDHPKDVEKILDFERIFQQPEYTAWKKLRQHPDARFISLAFSRITLRKPYKSFSAQKYGFLFEEVAQKISDYLWGNPAYYFAGVVIRSFHKTGWFLKIEGVEKDKFEGGIVEDLPVHYANEDASQFYSNPPLETLLKNWQEQFLMDQGFIILSSCHYSSYQAFNSCPTLYKPFTNTFAKVDSIMNVGLSQVLCVSRFAHYLKIIGRTKIGRFINAEELENYLQYWISNYTAYPTGHLTDEFIRKYPLKEARVELNKKLFDYQNQYFCTLFITPHQYREKLEGKIFLNLRLS